MKKTVLITGAAGGLGRSLTEVYLARDWKVIGTDIDPPLLKTVRPDSGHWFIPMDVTSDDSVRSVCDQLKAGKIQLDLIINNAGVDRYFPLSEAPVNEIKQVFEVNFFGGYRVNQIFLPLIRKPGGRIILISSESLNLTVPFMPYPLSKKALEGYAKVLRQELGLQGIDVVIVRPGAIRTPLLNHVRNLGPAAGTWQMAAPFRKFAEEAVKEIGRTISPEQAAAFIYQVSGIRNPAFLYRINNMLQLKIAALLPFRLMERMVRKRLSD